MNGELGPQIVAPDTPSVAAAGSNKLYFIDTRHTSEDAAHIKEQIEQAFVPKSNRRIEVDAGTGLVHNIDVTTGQVLFTFDMAYARVFFANLLNELDQNLDLPVHDPAGDQLVTYDLGTGETVRSGEAGLQSRLRCLDYSCWSNDSCRMETGNACEICHHFGGSKRRCERGVLNAIGGCPGHICSRAVDEPRQEGETDAAFHKRMDEKHWRH